MEIPNRDQERVLEAATSIAGGDAVKAARWYVHDRLEAFDRKTPATLVAQGRAADVLRYIALGAGPAG